MIFLKEREDNRMRILQIFICLIGLILSLLGAREAWTGVYGPHFRTRNVLILLCGLLMFLL